MVATLILFLVYQQDIREAFLDQSAVYSGADIKSLVIVSHKQRTDSEVYTVVGNIKNTGNISFKRVIVSAEVYDGEFIIGQCTASVNRGGVVEEGDTGSFVLDCAQLRQDNDFGYPYRVELVSAQKIDS